MPQTFSPKTLILRAVLTTSLLCLQQVYSFYFPASRNQVTFHTGTCSMQQYHRTVRSMMTSPFFTVVDNSNDGEENEKEPAKQLDSNGNEITVGKVLRITKELKAFHVSKKGFGKFDTETKEFVPDAEVGVLSIPIGLRGVATRVYDVNNSDANKPILIKFVAGENAEEGYSPPITFSMHFDSKEVECV